MYTQYYANPGHDSYIDAVPHFSNELAWKVDISSDEEKEIANRLILTDGKHYYVDALTEIICIGNDANILWRRQKYYGSQIVYNDGSIYYQSPGRKDDMEAVDSGNRQIIAEYPIPGVIEESFLVLFQPDKKGIFAQVQYADLPEVSVPEFILYRADEKSIGYLWYKRYYNEISPAIPLVNFENDFVLTFSQSEGHIFNLSEKNGASEPDYSFNLPTERDTLFASSSKSGDIFLAWSTGNLISLKGIDRKAQEKYTIEMENDFVGGAPVIWPPILTPEGFIYILTGNRIFCVKEGKLLWNREVSSAAYVTAFADNSVVIAAGKMIIHIDSAGVEKFIYEAEDQISAPVILNPDGGLIFCTKSVVYSLK